jgi:RHS repeat-associated protein
MKNQIRTNGLPGALLPVILVLMFAASCPYRLWARDCSFCAWIQVTGPTNAYWTSCAATNDLVLTRCQADFWVAVGGGSCPTPLVTNTFACTPSPGLANGYLMETNSTVISWVTETNGIYTTNYYTNSIYHLYNFTKCMTLVMSNNSVGLCITPNTIQPELVYGTIQIKDDPDGGCSCAANNNSPPSGVPNMRSSPPPGSSSTALYNGGPDLRVNVGAATSTSDGGFVWLSATTPSTSLATPSMLQVPFAETNVTVINSGAGWVQQVASPQSLVNVATNTAYKYQVQVFYTNSITGSSGGLYTTGTNTPFVSYTIENPDGATNTNRLWITETRSSLTNQYQYTYTSNTSQSMRWDVLKPDGTTVSSWCVTNSTNVAVTNYFWQTSVGTNILQQTCATVTFIADDVPLLTNSVVEGAGSITQTTSFTYYSTNAGAGSSNKLQRVDYPNGSWFYYVYNTNGLVTSQYSAYGNSTPPSDPTQQPDVVSNLCKLTTYDYTSVAATEVDAVTNNPSQARTIAVVLPVLVSGSWQAQEVSRTYQAFDDFCTAQGPAAAPRMEEQFCVLPGVAWEDTTTFHPGGWKALTNVNTITLSYPLDDVISEAGKPEAVFRADGTATLYTYSQTDTNFVTVESTGALIDGSYWGFDFFLVDVPWQLASGTTTTTVADQLGRMQSRTVVDIVTGATLANDVYTYDTSDLSGRNYTLTDLAGRTTTYVYACCGLESVTDPDGVVTTYTYDSLKRLIATTVTRGGTNSVTTSSLLDGLGRILVTQRTGTNGSMITLGQSQYDVLGRVVNQTNALNGTTGIAYGTNSNQQVVTNTFPDGGTSITLNYRDGSLQSMTGSAVQPVRYTNFVASDGSYYRQVQQAIKLDANGSDTSEWTESFTDGAGEEYKTAYASSGTPPVALSYFNNYGQVWKQVDPDGVIILYTYNGRGQREYAITALSSTATNETSYSSLLGDLGTILGATDRVTFMTNDVVTNGSDVALRTRTYVWNQNSSSSSNLASTSLDDPNGLASTNIIWNNGQGVTNWSQTVYAGSGSRYTTNMAPDGSYTVNAYSYGQLQSVTWKDNGNSQVTQTSYGYDPHWRQNTVTDARTGTTTNFFNNMDLVYETATPASGTGQNSEVTTNGFDSMGRITKTTLPDSTSVTNIYYPTGQIQQTSGSRTYPVGYSYDAQGRMKTMTNWSGFASAAGARVTTWNYDAYRGWLTNKVYDGGTAGPGYGNTPAGRLAIRYWARGTNTTYSYDQAGGLATVIYNDGVTAGITNSYDRLGRLTNVLNGAITCTLGYNDVGIATNEAYSGGVMDKISITNGYDQFLRRTNLVTLYNGSVLTTITNNYDAASRLWGIGDGTNSATYSYLTNSPLVSQIIFKQNGTNRMTTAKTYDNLNRLTLISSTTNSVVVDKHGYAYNSANQRSTVTNTDSSFWSYQYDSLGQVISGKKYWSDGTPVAGEQFGYGFDDIGNRTSAQAGGNDRGEGLRNASYTANKLNQYTSRTVPGAADIIGTALSTAAVTVNGQPTYRHSDYFREQLTIDNSEGGVWQGVTNLGVVSGATNTVSNMTGNIFLPQNPETFLYDADGNLTNDGRWSYTWDAENRLINMTSLSSAPSAASKFKLDFTYDYQGRRIQKLVSTNNGSYVASHTNRFIYDSWHLVDELNGANNDIFRSYLWGLDLSGTLFGAGGIGGLIAAASPDEAQFVCFDGDGNTATLVDTTSGISKGHFEYDAFGALIECTSSQSRTFPFLFSTKYCDSESDLYYFGYRYYAPSCGRWLSRDPLEERGSINLYSFVNNNPQSYVDPEGRFLLSALVNVGIGWALAEVTGQQYTLKDALTDFAIGLIPGPDMIMKLKSVAKYAKCIRVSAKLEYQRRVVFDAAQLVSGQGGLAKLAVKYQDIREAQYVVQMTLGDNELVALYRGNIKTVVQGTVWTDRYTAAGSVTQSGQASFNFQASAGGGFSFEGIEQINPPVFSGQDIGVENPSNQWNFPLRPGG